MCSECLALCIIMDNKSVGLYYRPSQMGILSPGGTVRVEGGRFKGREGVIVEVRGGVVRGEMQGEEGPVSADMAAAYVVGA